MAYPTVSAPYGFRPINRVDGMPYAGATRTYGIASGSASIFYGDLVVLVNGLIQRFTGTDSGYPVGVFVGASYTNSMSQPVHGQYFPTGTTNATGKVVVDDQAAYKVVVTDGTDVTELVVGDIGSNIAVVLGAGNATTGDSGMSVDSTDLSGTATYPIRIIDVVPETATSTGFPEVIVKINVTQFQNAAGV